MNLSKKNSTYQSIIDKLNSLPTKDDLKNFATRTDLDRLATKDDLKNFATRTDLDRLATKEEIQVIREDMKTQTKELQEFAMDQTEALARVIEETVMQPLEDVRSRVTLLEHKVHKAC